MDPWGEVAAVAEKLATTTPSSPNEAAMQMNPHLMGQVCPGLWVGELTSIKEIRKLRPLPPPLSTSNQSISTTAATFPVTDTATTTTKWTIISLLKSEKLKHFIHSTLDAIQKEEAAAAAAAAQENDNEKQQQHHHHPQNDIASSVVSTQHRIVIQRHVEWEIADKSESDFLSPRLEEILIIMEEALGDTHIDKNKEASQEASTSSSSSSSCCLVHCALGVSRSVALCAAYLLWKQQQQCHANKITLQAALTQIRAMRPQAAPNMGFIACLRALEQCHGNVALARKRMAASKQK